MSRASPFPLLLIVLLAGLAFVPLLAVASSLIGAPLRDLLDAAAFALPTYGATTLALMLLVALASGTIGIGTAWLVSMTAFPGRRVLSWLLILPLAAPAYIIAYYYTDLLEYGGPIQSALRSVFGWDGPGYWFPEIRSLPGAALMLSLVLYPYVYLLTRASFTILGARQWMAARSLGDGPWRAFWRIALPTARPAIAGGLSLVMMETLADYGVADYFAIQTFSTGIFRTWLGIGDRTLALQLAAMMLGLVIVLVVLEEISRKGRTDTGGKGAAAVPRVRLGPGHSLLAVTACALPVLLGFVIPAVGLAAMSVAVGDAQSWVTLASYAANSASVAGMTAMAAVVFASLLAYAARTRESLFARTGIRIATLGYALPGALLAIGLLVPLSAADQVLTRVLRDGAGWSGGLVLTGTVTALVYALVIRFLTVSYNSVSSGLSRVPPAMDAAARSLGARPARVFRDIHLPLIRPSLGAGILLVFIDTLRELPATLILRPFNFETLATRVYRLASDERLAEASTAALLIVALGVVPVLLLDRLRDAPADATG